MRTLYHWPLDPPSRQARIALAEKKLKFKLVQVNPWEPEEDFLTLCPEGAPPMFIDVTADGKVIISGARAICEYIHEGSTKHPLLPDNPRQRAESRRICQWFDIKFAAEVNAYLMHERIEKTVIHAGTPHPPTLRMGREHLAFHLDYVDWLLKDREWLAGSAFSLADAAAGANLSCLDFLGEINWKTRPAVKDWYQKLKSRPSFRPLLADRLPGLKPPRHYTDLDF